MRYAWIATTVLVAACSAADPPGEDAELGPEPGSVSSATQASTDEESPTPPAPSESPLAVVRAWERDDVTMGPSFLADDGEVLLGAAGAVYAAGGYDGGPVRRLDPATGEDVWTSPLGETPFVLAADRQRVVAFDSFAPEMVALDAEDGTVLWRRSVPAGDPPREGNAYAAARATLTEGGMLLVGLTADGEGATDPPLVLRLDPATGDTQWTAALDEGLDLLWQAPALVDEVVIVQSVRSHPGSATATPAYAIDVETGQVAWKQADVPEFDAFPMRDTVVRGVGGRVHLTHPRNGTVTVQAASGEVLWTDAAMQLAALMDDGSLLAVRDGQLARVDGATGAPTHTEAAARSPRITGLSVGPVGIFAIADGHLAVVDRVTGHLRRTDVSLAPTTQLRQVDDVLISRQQGTVIALRVGDRQRPTAS